MTSRLRSLLALALLATGVAHAETQFRIDRFTSNHAWNANSWILSSDVGLVLIDGQMLKGDAKRLAAMLKTYEKPLAGVIITHPHPDHFLGLAELRRQLGEFAIIAGADSAASFDQARDRFIGWARDVYGDDIETDVVPATRIIESDTTLELAGITLKLDRFGAGESVDHLMVYQPDRKLLFTGDVVMYGSHHYVGEGRSKQLLTQLMTLKRDYAGVARLFPGHGDPSQISPIDDLIDYVQQSRSTFQEISSMESNHHPSEPRLSDSARKQFVDRMAAAYPTLGDFGIGVRQILSMNLSGLEMELLANSPETAAP
jgi:glyoxylase-like metal-dependent hydrolase (beta-lactamase superfamily II)